MGSTLTAGYTGESLRGWKQQFGQGKHYFLYDGASPVCELDAAGNWLASNVWGASGLVARDSNPESLYYKSSHKLVKSLSFSAELLLFMRSSADLTDEQGAKLSPLLPPLRASIPRPRTTC